MSGSRHRRARRRARAGRARRATASQRAVHAVGRPHLPLLRRGGEGTTMRIVDVRHEQTATFAAEGIGQADPPAGRRGAHRRPRRHQRDLRDHDRALQRRRRWSCSAVGRPQARWGAGSLQEFDHVPVRRARSRSRRRPSTRRERRSRAESTSAVRDRAHAAPRAGVLRLPARRRVRDAATSDVPDAVAATPASSPTRTRSPRGRALIAGAERPALHRRQRRLLGRRVRTRCGACVEALRVPVFVNGLGRGCLPADHELAVLAHAGCSRRGRRGRRRRHAARLPPVVRLVRRRAGRARRRHARRSGPATSTVAASPRRRPARRSSTAIAAARASAPTTSRGSRTLRDEETRGRGRGRARARRPTPTRSSRRASTASCARRLDRDAVVICDGGDFVSYAGKYVDSYEPGCWLDPGPYGCLGTGLGLRHRRARRPPRPPGRAAARRRRRRLLAAWTSTRSCATTCRSSIVVGNNGIWGLEKHPMQAIYGYDVAADLQPGCRYDEVVEALGGAGEIVERRRRHRPRPRSRLRRGRARTSSTCSPTPTTPTRAPPTSLSRPARRSGRGSPAVRSCSRSSSPPR